MTGLTAKGQLLVEERKRRGLTRLQAAVGIGISPQTLARAEAGRSVQPKSLREIADFYKLDAIELSVPAA